MGAFVSYAISDRRPDIGRAALAKTNAKLLLKLSKEPLSEQADGRQTQHGRQQQQVRVCCVSSQASRLATNIWLHHCADTTARKPSQIAGSAGQILRRPGPGPCASCTGRHCYASVGLSVRSLDLDGSQPLACQPFGRWQRAHNGQE